MFFSAVHSCSYMTLRCKTAFNLIHLIKFDALVQVFTGYFRYIFAGLVWLVCLTQSTCKTKENVFIHFESSFPSLR